MSVKRFLFSFNKSVSPIIRRPVRSRRRLFVKGDRKKESLSIFCTPSTFMKRSRSVQAVSSILDCSLTPVHYQSQTPAYFQKSFSRLPSIAILSFSLSLFPFSVSSPHSLFVLAQRKFTQLRRLKINLQMSQSTISAF